METLRRGAILDWVSGKSFLSRHLKVKRCELYLVIFFLCVFVCFKELENGDRYYHGKNGNMCLIWIVYLEPAL